MFNTAPTQFRTSFRPRLPSAPSGRILRIAGQDHVGELVGVLELRVRRRLDHDAGGKNDAVELLQSLNDAVREALERLDPLWNELFPAEQARIYHLGHVVMRRN